jgi:hypothetical protein
MANPGCLAVLRRLFAPTASPERRFGGPAYRLRDDFVSPAERSFYRVLCDAIGGRYAICPKVSLGDLFYAPHPDRGRALGLMNRIDRKHVDLLLCDPETLAPLAGIELDDASHRQPRRAKRDRLVYAVFRAAGLPLLRLRVRHAYDVEDLAALVADTLAPRAPAQDPDPLAEETAAEIPVPEMAPAAEAGSHDEPELDAPALADLTEDPDPLAFYTPTYRPPAPGEVPRPSTVARELALTAGRRVATPVAVSSGWAVGDEPPLCPRCGREMVLRTAKNGRHKGGAFWGCPCYPKCRMIVRIDPSGGSDDDWS